MKALKRKIKTQKRKNRLHVVGRTRRLLTGYEFGKREMARTNNEIS